MNRAALADPIEQIVVSLHERLHLELQHTTPWGLLTEMLSLLASRHPDRLLGLERAARYGKNASRTAHEVYATTHSVAARERHRAWLDVNVEHVPYYELGVRLSIGDLEDSRYLFDALIRCAMSPAAMLDVIARGLDRVRLRSLDQPDRRPDDRLEQLLRLDLTALQSLQPAGNSVGELADYHDEVAAEIRRQGLDVLSSDEIRVVFGTIIGSVGVLDPPLAQRIELDTEREPLSDDVEASQLERVVLRSRRLPSALVDPATATTSDFIQDDPTFGPHVILVWADARRLHEQYELADVDNDGYIAAMVAPVLEHGRVNGVSVLAVDGSGGPDVLAQHLGFVPTIVLTTSTSLMDAPATATSEHVPVLYALVDGPILNQLEHTFGSHGHLTWDSFNLRRGEELCVTVFALNVLPGIRWLHLGTIAARSYLVSWLESKEGSNATHAKGAFDDERTRIDILTRFVTLTWSVVAQTA